MNIVIIKGFIGKDPEVKALDNDKKVAKFSVATNEYGDKVEWHNIVCWDKKADLIEQYFSKGKEILVKGRLQTNQWESEGIKHYRTEIVADNIEFCGSKGDSEGNSQPLGQTPPRIQPDLDDVPF